MRVRQFTLRVIPRESFHPTDDHYSNEPVLRIYRSFTNGNHGDPSRLSKDTRSFIQQKRPFAFLGSPQRPGDAHISFESMSQQGAELYSRAIVHELHHAVFGLNDEYGMLQDGSGRETFTSFCAETEALRRAWNACIMGTYQPLHRELCQPNTHTDRAVHANLHAVDCYTRVKLSLQNARRADARFRNLPDLVVPETPVEGPDNPPEVRFTWK